MYNDAKDDKNDEYHFSLTVTGSSYIDIFSLISDDGVPDFINYNAIATYDTATYPAVHPSNDFVYIANDNDVGTDDTILMYRIMDDGTLLTIGTGSITTGENPQTVKVHPSGKFVYVSNGGDNNISMYGVNSDGTLANLIPSTIPSDGLFPYRMAIDPAGNYLFVVNVDGESIVSYSINNTTGQLTLISSFHNVIDRAITSDIRDVVVDLFGHLYICSSSGIFFYNWPAYLTFIESNFILQAPPANNRYLALNPSGKYLYLISDAKDVTAYQVSSDGTLSSSPVSQLVNVGGIGGMFYDILVHPSGKYIYLSDWGDDHIYYLKVNNDGSLTLGSSNLHRNAYGLSIFRKKVK